MPQQTTTNIYSALELMGTLESTGWQHQQGATIPQVEDSNNADTFTIYAKGSFQILLEFELNWKVDTLSVFVEGDHGRKSIKVTERRDLMTGVIGMIEQEILVGR